MRRFSPFHRQIPQPIRRRVPCRCNQRPNHPFKRRDFLHRLPQANQIPPVARPGRQPAQHPFQVAHTAQFQAELVQRRAVLQPKLHRVPPPHNRTRRRQRRTQPVPQPPRPHRRHRAIDSPVKAFRPWRVPPHRLQNLQVPQRRRIQRHVIRVLIKRNPRQRRHIPPQLLRQVMQHRPRRSDCRRPVPQPKPVQRRHLEMLPHREHRRLRRKHPILARIENRAPVPRQTRQIRRARRVNNLRWPQPLQLREQRRLRVQFGSSEITRSQIHQRQPKDTSARTHRRQKIIPVRRQQPLVEMRPRAENLRHLPLHELPRPGLLQLLANRDLSSRLQQPRDIPARRVKGDAAHRDLPPLRQRHIQQLRPGMGVLEKHLIKIPQPEQQQRLRRQFALDAAVLRHHGR